MTLTNHLRTTNLTLAAAALSLAGSMAHAQTFTSNVIVQGSLCTGFDCVTGESFGFDTLRLKENNLRINFADTSSSASFPTADWRIVANDSSNGGGNYLAIEDVDAGRQTFRVDQGAPANALRVDSAGDVGIGIANPVVDLHIASGNTPTMRLEQNGTSGFTPQTYDVAANEANFFIRDVTNGSALFFRSRPGAPADSLYIAANGDIGLGTASPDEDLHIASAETRVAIEMQNSTSATDNFQIAYDNTDLRLSRQGSGVIEMSIASGGNVTIAGTLTTGSTTVYPDYVFEPDYDLMPLNEVDAFIVANGHLPKIPTAEEVAETGLNISEMQVALLEKVEELTLYTLAQQRTIDALQVRIDALAVE